MLRLLACRGVFCELLLGPSALVASATPVVYHEHSHYRMRPSVLSLRATKIDFAVSDVIHPCVFAIGSAMRIGNLEEFVEGQGVC
jgi:hypothetical protein